MSIFADFSYNKDKKIAPRTKKSTGDEHDERSKRSTNERFAEMMANRLSRDHGNMVGSQIMSLLFRSRGLPSLDMFTESIITDFRIAMGIRTKAEGEVRKLISIMRWMTNTVDITMWTTEPVVSTMMMNANSASASSDVAKYSEEIVIMEPMSMTSHMTVAKAGNRLQGRWAGWIMGRSAHDRGFTDSVCINCNLCSNGFMFAMQAKDMSLVYLAMTPESLKIIDPVAKAMAPSLGVTVVMNTKNSTKINIQPSINKSRNSSLRLFGNGSMQFTGSPSDVVCVYSAAVLLIKRVMDTNMIEFLSSMRALRKVVV